MALPESILLYLCPWYDREYGRPSLRWKWTGAVLSERTNYHKRVIKVPRSSAVQKPSVSPSTDASRAFPYPSRHIDCVYDLPFGLFHFI